MKINPGTISAHIRTDNARMTTTGPVVHFNTGARGCEQNNTGCHDRKTGTFL